MKILMAHPHDIFSPNEPWTVRVVSLAKEFRDMGHEVVLGHCPLHIDEHKRQIGLEGITIITLSRKAGLKTIFTNLRKLKKYSGWADVIHFQKCFHYVSVPAVISAFLSGKPLHYDWDDWEEKIWYHSNKKSIHTFVFGFFLKILERLLPLLADSVSVASQKLEDLCLNLGVKNENLYRAHVGADLKKFSPDISAGPVRKKYNLGHGMVILYLGQLHGGQYVEMFIQSANVVLRRHPGAVFLILGQGYMLQQLKEFTFRLGIDNRVLFTGSVHHDLIPQYIAASDICVASFEKNEITMCKSPLKLVEYLASGKPIVSSLAGEARNMVGGAGLLVRPDDYNALADGIIKLIEKPRLRREMSLRARRRAEATYNWKTTAKNLINAYEASLN